MSDMLTIDETAIKLGVSSRKLRRFLRTEGFADRTETVVRQTRTGPRSAELVPPDLYADLERELLRPVPEAVETKAENVGNASMTVFMPEYLRLVLDEKDKRIDDLVKTLEHERAISQTLADAVARTQALLAMSQSQPPAVPPEPKPEDPPPTLIERIFGRRKR